MIYMSLIWLTFLSFLFNVPGNQQYARDEVPYSVAEKIVGTWYLEEQEMFINGKEIYEHFEDLAAQLSANSDYRVNPQLLAKKFRQGFNGIPTGTVFIFEDNFSYRIILPNKETQTGMWRIRNDNDVLLQAADQELLLRVKDLSEDSVVVSIREAKVDSQLGAGGYTVMEIVMGLSR